VAFDGGTAEDQTLVIGSHSFIDGFEDQMIGMNIGEEKDINVTFPEDYHSADLAGKPAVFHVKVNDIKEEQMPELDDEFASEVSEFDTMAEYREDVKVKLGERKASAAKDVKEEAVINAIIEDAQMDIPDAMLETQQRQMVEEFAQRIQAQGLSMEQYMQFTGVTPATMMEQVKDQALLRIKSRLVLEAVAKAEKFEASDADFEDEIKTMSEAYQLEPDKVKELLGENGAKQVREDICIKKAVEFVVENAKETKPKKTRAKKEKVEEKTEE